MKFTLKSNSREETKHIALTLAPLLNRGDVITFTGDLGAGKTAFVQDLADGLEIKDRVNSPTFNILKPYFYGRIPLYHIDAYRLEDGNKNIGLEEFIDGDGVAVIEWPNFISELIPSDHLTINIVNDGDTKRTLTFEANGKRHNQLLSDFKEKL